VSCGDASLIVRCETGNKINDSESPVGTFWDPVEGRAPLRRAPATLGIELIDADVEHGTIELALQATEDFTNLRANVLGAFLGYLPQRWRRPTELDG
jgi:hypothetical protein